MSYRRFPVMLQYGRHRDRGAGPRPHVKLITERRACVPPPGFRSIPPSKYAHSCRLHDAILSCLMSSSRGNFGGTAKVTNVAKLKSLQGHSPAKAVVRILDGKVFDEWNLQPAELLFVGCRYQLIQSLQLVCSNTALIRWIFFYPLLFERLLCKAANRQTGKPECIVMSRDAHPPIGLDSSRFDSSSCSCIIWVLLFTPHSNPL